MSSIVGHLRAIFHTNILFLKQKSLLLSSFKKLVVALLTNRGFDYK
jgi:hypothetical protein